MLENFLFPPYQPPERPPDVNVLLEFFEDDEAYLARALFFEFSRIPTPSAHDELRFTLPLHGEGRMEQIRFWYGLDGRNPVDRTALRLLARAACFAPDTPIAPALLQRCLGPHVSAPRAQQAFSRLCALGLLEPTAGTFVRIRGATACKVLLHTTTSADQTTVITVLLTAYTGIARRSAHLATHITHLLGHQHVDEEVIINLLDSFSSVGHPNRPTFLRALLISTLRRIQQGIHGPERSHETLRCCFWLAYVCIVDHDPSAAIPLLEYVLCAYEAYPEIDLAHQLLLLIARCWAISGSPESVLAALAQRYAALERSRSATAVAGDPLVEPCDDAEREAVSAEIEGWLRISVLHAIAYVHAGNRAWDEAIRATEAWGAVMTEYDIFSSCLSQRLRDNREIVAAQRATAPTSTT